MKKFISMMLVLMMLMSIGVVFADEVITTSGGAIELTPSEVTKPDSRYFSTEDYAVLEILYKLHTDDLTDETARENVLNFIRKNQITEKDAFNREIMLWIENRIIILSEKTLTIKDVKEVEDVVKEIEYRQIKLTKEMNKKLTAVIKEVNKLQKDEDSKLEEIRIQKIMDNMPKWVNLAERDRTTEALKKAMDAAIQLDQRDNQVKGWNARLDILQKSMKKESADKNMATLDKFLVDRKLITSDWSKGHIFRASELGILNGTRMHKNNDLTTKVTRTDFAEIVMNYVKREVSAERLVAIKRNSADVFYADIDVRTQYSIIEATQLGLVEGMGNGLFEPEELVTREQMAVMINRAMKIVNLNSADTRQDVELAIFSDRNVIAAWARQGVANMTAVRAIEGNRMGMFVPKGYTTKEQAIKIIVELMK